MFKYLDSSLNSFDIIWEPFSLYIITFTERSRGGTGRAAQKNEVVLCWCVTTLGCRVLRKGQWWYLSKYWYVIDENI